MSHTPDFHDQCRQLTETHRHREPYTVTERGTAWVRGHVTTVPSLIGQLDQGISVSTGEGGFGGFGSRPVAHLEALDTLVSIDLEASRWVRDLGEDDPLDTAACIRRLHGLHASAATVTKRAIEADVRRWWNQARIVTGWDSPAWRPDNTCPMCAKRGGLRVRLATQSGLCIECRETWGAHNIGLLAEHIRSENDEEQHAESEHEA